MVTDAAPQPSFSPRRRWAIALNVAISVLALAGIVVLVNYLASRHFKRFQWNAQPRVQLSPLTARVLDSITNEVKAIVFYDRAQPLYGTVAELLQTYRIRSRRLSIDYVDHVRDPGRAATVYAEYKLGDPSDERKSDDRIIFACQGKTRIVYAKDLSEYDFSEVFQGQPAKRIGFRGEQLFTSAIYAVIDPQPVVAYFAQGHGELDISEQGGSTGYSQFARLLVEQNITVRQLSSNTDIPDDCQLLIVAGPLHGFPPAELERIDRFLNQGGRMFVLFRQETVTRRTGLERILENWGVEVGQNYILDPENQNATKDTLLVINEFGPHPITDPLRRSGLALVRPRSVRPHSYRTQSANAPKVVELAFTSSQGEAMLMDGARPRPDPAGSGRISVAAAVERGSIQGISADRGATRIVVAGDAYFLSDAVMDYKANRDFARNAANWLLSRELLLEGIGPHPVHEYRINITRGEFRVLLWLFLGAAPGAVLAVGGIIWLRRRS